MIFADIAPGSGLPLYNGMVYQPDVTVWYDTSGDRSQFVGCNQCLACWDVLADDGPGWLDTVVTGLRQDNWTVTDGLDDLTCPDCNGLGVCEA